MTSTAAKRKASCSDAQQLAEELIVAELSKIVGVELNSAELKLGITKVSVDGFAQNGNRVVLVEAWAHIGKIKSAQRNKIHSDLLKLGLIRTGLLRSDPSLTVDSYIAFADEAAAAIVKSGRCWASAAAREFGITPRVVKLPEEVLQKIREAQKRQDIREPDENENHD